MRKYEELIQFLLESDVSAALNRHCEATARQKPTLLRSLVKEYLKKEKVL